MKVLVTGGTGFLGQNLVSALLRSNYQVVVYDNLSRADVNHKLDLDQVEYIVGDVRDKNKLEKSTKSVSTVVHLASINGTSNFYLNPRETFEVSALGTLNVIDSSIKNNVENLIFSSSAEIYGDPTAIPTKENSDFIVHQPYSLRYSYGGGKLAAELMIRYLAAGKIHRSIVFRPHNFYGPNMGQKHVIPEIYQKIINNTVNTAKDNLKESTIEIYGTGVELRTFCYIDDIIQGIVLLLDSGVDQEVYNIGGNEPINIATLIELMASKLNTKVKIISLDNPPGSPKVRIPDITKIKKLGYSPRVDLNEGISKTIDWYSAIMRKNKFDQ
jgi:UDP-glucose 4-epimerase